MEGSHSYQLDSHLGHSRGPGSKGGIAAIAPANEAAWDWKDRMVTSSEDKSGSDGYAASLPDSDKTLPLKETTRPVAPDGPSQQRGNHQGRAQRGKASGKIMVTTEYTVAPEQGQGPGRSNNSRVW